MVVLIVVYTMGTVCDGGFVGSGCAVDRDGGVAVLLRWGSIVACSWISGCVGLSWTWTETGVGTEHF